MVWHGMFRVVPFAFSVEKSTPAGKKYTCDAGGAGDKLRLCVGWDGITEPLHDLITAQRATKAFLCPEGSFAILVWIIVHDNI